MNATHPMIQDKERWKNMRVGLFGGSFNPPHEGHLHVAQSALKYLHLDYIWWLVTPQNPLKQDTSTSVGVRTKQCKDLIKTPYMIATDFEKHLNTENTYQTAVKIKHIFPETQFTWICGMDNAINFHDWKNWQKLLDEISFFFLTRPPADEQITCSPLYTLPKQQNISIKAPQEYDLNPNKTFWLLDTPANNQSSTKIRKNINADQICKPAE